MDQLIDEVVQRTGLPRDKAQQAAQVCVGFLKNRLPAPMASQVDAIMSGGTTGSGMPAQAQQGFGGMFGKQQQPPQPQ